MDILLAQTNLGSRKILSICWLVEANLHGHLHHETTEHEGRVGRRAIGGKRPGAEQTERLDNMVGRLGFHNRLPYQIGQGLLQANEQALVGFIVAGGHADDSPEKQTGIFGIVIWGPCGIEEGQELVVEGEEIGEELVDLNGSKLDILKGMEHGRSTSQVQ